MIKKLHLFIAIIIAGSLTAQTSIPNSGFEKWNYTSWLDPQYYITSNVNNITKGLPVNVTQSSSSYHAKIAVQMTTVATGSDTSAGYFFDGQPTNSGFQGGIPYSQKPTGLRFYYKYTRTATDTGVVLCIFKLGGTTIGGKEIKLDTAKNYKLSYTTFSLPIAPDSIMFGGLSSIGAIQNTDKQIPGSTLIIDSVTFTGVTSQPAMLNGDLESWVGDTLKAPQGWYIQNNSSSVLSNQTTDAYTGNYALIISSVLQNYQGADSTFTAEATTGIESNNGLQGGYPFTHKVDTIEFYYKYAPANPNDSAIMQVGLKNSGVFILYRDTMLAASASYKRVRVPFSSNSTPDSVTVTFNSSKKWRTGPSYTGAVLKVDNVRFLSQAVPPVAAFTGGTVVCVGSTINYASTSLNAPSTVSWTFGGGSPGTSGLASQSVLYSVAGPYTTKLVVSNSAGSDSITSTVTVVTAPTIKFTGNTAICSGTNTIITASGGNTYLWSTGSTNDTINVSPASTKTYSVTATAIGGCSASNSQAVTVTQTPPAPSAGSNSPLCSGTTLNFNATAANATSYTWTGPNGFSSGSQNPFISSAQVLASGTYTVTGTNGGCTGPIATESVTVNQTPAAPSAGSNGPICSGITLNLNSNSVGATGYTWTGPNGFSSGSQNPFVTNAQVVASGTYSVTTSSAAGCTSTLGTVAVIVNPTPTVSASYNPNNDTICNGSNVVITAAGGGAGATYTWSPNIGLSATTGAMVTANPTGDQKYTVVATTTLNCSNTLDTAVYVKTCVTGIESLNQLQQVVVYPNPSNGVFTIEVKSEEFKVKNVEIYNILGEQVCSPFTIHHSQFTIDLSSRPAGIYFYTIYNTAGEAIDRGKLIIK